ncbi:hypothetical protein [Methanococcus aeolicus]|uniref:Uncharacterized protein n=1 Tax=Methanococcus aeolicus (strain ATCC BAA-1280 / DSM 17508 / OCM 812 / Nankai-3) TaxID=419665 RepID=A6UWB1_META3|nr:hypothetical protein [Methanococcus aeolicus]ABR56783.1 conserved hypothetical protein [Methanococcus aeolicus Nankai-3]UXM84797.1 hypothetical protein N6C89_00410 [Methanococcus aeolicus]
MDYSIIVPILDKENLLIDRGSLKTKRKFAFLLEEGDIIFANNILGVDEEVEVLLDYTYSENTKRPKENIEVYTIKELIKE